jgi:hypothetical protein
MDTRIRNTPEELDKYDPRTDRLLDRIFDDFGIIVCGWSAEWDSALRAAIERCPSRRFTGICAVRETPEPSKSAYPPLFECNESASERIGSFVTTTFSVLDNILGSNRIF